MAQCRFGSVRLALVTYIQVIVLLVRKKWVSIIMIFFSAKSRREAKKQGEQEKKRASVRIRKEEKSLNHKSHIPRSGRSTRRAKQSKKEGRKKERANKNVQNFGQAVKGSYARDKT